MSEKVGVTSPYRGDYEDALRQTSDGWVSMENLSSQYETSAEVTVPEGAEVVETIKDTDDDTDAGEQQIHTNDQAEALRRMMRTQIGGKVVEAAETLETKEVADEPMEESEEASEKPAETANDEGGHEQLDEWVKSLEGTVEEYWQKMNDDQYVERNVVIGEMPDFGDLRDKAMESLRNWLPEMSVEAMKQRVDLATKIAMQEYADRKGKALAGAKVERRGFLKMDYRRRLPKGYDEDLTKTVQKDVRNVFRDIYADTNLKVADGQPEDEMIAWMVMGEELGKPNDQKVLSRQLDQHPRREGEGADAYVQRIRNYAAGGQALAADKVYDEDHLQSEAADESEVPELSLKEELATTDTVRSEKFTRIDAMLPDASTPEGKLKKYEAMAQEIERRVNKGRDQVNPNAFRHFDELLDELTKEIYVMRAKLAVEAGDKSKEAENSQMNVDQLGLVTAERRGLISRKDTATEQFISLTQRLQECRQGFYRSEKELEEARTKDDQSKVELAMIEHDNYADELNVVRQAMRALRQNAPEELTDEVIAGIEAQVKA